MLARPSPAGLAIDRVPFFSLENSWAICLILSTLRRISALGGRGAGVDFLRPGLDRDLDAEGLVDGEDDVEEVEAVDAEVVDDMRLGRDLLGVEAALPLLEGIAAGAGPELLGHGDRGSASGLLDQRSGYAHLPG